MKEHKMWGKLLFICCFIIGILNVHSDATSDTKSTASSAVELTTSVATQSDSSTALTSTLATAPATDETTKDKRQIGRKDEAVYANHRSDTVDADDPENPQETIYGPKPNQFIIRPIAPHEHQQHEDHQEPQLRNYPATVRPHSTQTLEQSQEIQHFAYLQDINRNHPKSSASASELTGKPHQPKKSSKSGRAHSPPQQYRNSAEEAEQRYAIAIQAPNPTSAQAPHYAPPPPQQLTHRYQLAAPLHQQQYLAPAGQPGAPQSGAPQQPYQIIPEEEFLKLLEEELRARAYHEAQFRQQQTAPAPPPNKAPHPTERVGHGLGQYRQQAQAPQPQVLAEQPAPQYVQYVPRHRGGPRYLPQPQPQVQPQLQQQSEPQTAEPAQEAAPPPPPHIPPQLAYYQPQVNYKTLHNHPLAKSSLENEIEKLLAANKPSLSHLTDNSNEPSGVIHHHAPQQELQPQPIPRPRSRPYSVQQKAYTSQPTPTPLVDANNQPFIPSLFKFSNSQQPQPIYATQIPQHLVESKKLGPVIYPPTQAPNPAQQQQPTQYFYQELTPTARPKSQRSKQYGSKVSTSSPKLREKEPPNYPNVPAAAKYLHPHLYYEQSNGQGSQQQQQQPIHFHPSPPDPNNPTHEQHQQQQLQQQLQPQAQHYAAASPPQHQQHHSRQYAAPPPSQSSIFVSQGTGIATPSRSTSVKPTKSIEDVRHLQLPQPGGKPLTQSEFQALIDAGYPVTAVPVPVPVPYEQYIKEHPELRNQPLDYAQLMQRIAQQYGPRRGLQAQPSEPSPNIASDDGQTASAMGGGSITYLRPVAEQKRHPRDEKETAVAGKTEEAKQ